MKKSKNSLKGKDLTYDLHFSLDEIWQVLKIAKDLKRKQKMGKSSELLKGKSLAMIFQKPSTRTRVSFEVGMAQLGGHALYLGLSDLQLSRGETIADTARVLSRYADGIMARVFAHQDIIDLAANSDVPVINGLSDKYHPCQALTDLFTVWEKKGKFENLKLSFVGDGNNNVTNSLLLLCARLGVSMSVGCPESYTTDEEIIDMAKAEARRSGAKIVITSDAAKAVSGADVIYTDVWVSMGRSDAEARKRALFPYQVNRALVAKAKSDVLVMHCLPAHREEEITNEIIDGPHSVVFDQAENRLHVQKAIMALTM